MEVINDSTTMQSRIDAVLAAPIMEWDFSPDIQWQPGDPLWKHPDERSDEVIDYSGPALQMPHGWYASRPDVGGGNCPRYMLEIVGYDDYFAGTDRDGNVTYEPYFGHDDTMDGALHLVDCDDCMVGLGDDEVNCWVCGKRVLMETKAAIRAEQKAQMEQQAQIYWMSWWNAMAGANDGLTMDRRILTVPRRSSRSNLIEGLRANMSVVDEIGHIEWPSDPRIDFVEYPAWDAGVTMQMYLQTANPEDAVIHPYNGPLDPNDPSLYVNNYHINLDDPLPEQGALMYWSSSQRRWAEMRLREIMDNQEPALPEVPRITLQETNPALYRPGYERYFESENDNVRTSPAERRRGHGRAGAPRHRQG